MAVKPKSLKPRGPKEILAELLEVPTANGRLPMALHIETTRIDKETADMPPAMAQAAMQERYGTPFPSMDFSALSVTLQKIARLQESGEPLTMAALDGEDRQRLAAASHTLSRLRNKEIYYSTMMDSEVPSTDAAQRNLRISRENATEQIPIYDRLMYLADELSNSLGITTARSSGTQLPGK